MRCRAMVPPRSKLASMSAAASACRTIIWGISDVRSLVCHCAVAAFTIALTSRLNDASP
jgi:hypothetical protein